jgi:hypothetical protein
MFLDYTRSRIELVNQKMFEMRFKKISHSTYLVIFHLKMIDVKMLINHIIMVITPKNAHLWYDNY